MRKKIEIKKRIKEYETLIEIESNFQGHAKNFNRTANEVQGSKNNVAMYLSAMSALKWVLKIN